MKLLKITTLNPAYIDSFYFANPGLAAKSYSEQRAAIDHDASAWADFWPHALTPLGYDVLEIAYNVEPMQRAWAREHLAAFSVTLDLLKVAVLQAQSYQPDILWFNDYDEKLLVLLKDALPQIKLVLGWTGSAIPRTEHWKHIDLVLSCAQESVNSLRQAGCRAEQLHHGFDPRIINCLEQREKQYDFTFIGQLYRYSQYHLNRENLLLELSKATGILIFSSSARLGLTANFKSSLVAGIHCLLAALKHLGVRGNFLKSLPRIGILTDSAPPPLLAVHPGLRRYLRNDVYGLNMFQVLLDSRISLNIHADSSPLFASNMRLFEATGVGTCLLTDWRDNITELFVPDVEVATYRCLDECIEKSRWLLDHPVEREAMALAGQQRVLKDHTFAKRAMRLDQIIHKMI
jgi:hypothetical protein